MRLILAVLLLPTACAVTRTTKPILVADASGTVAAAEVATRTERISMPTPLDGLAPDLADAFGGYNLLYFAGAIGATGALAWSGADHRIDERTARTNEDRPWHKSASVAGYVVPTLIPTALWVGGLTRGDRELAGAGAASIQAVIVTMSTVGILKLATGRPRPVVDESIDDSQQARTFEPFQRISSWPSGHGAGTTTVAAVLTAYYPEKHWIPALGYPLALAIGVGMIDLEGHWTSDVLAGALIGQAIGYSIGRNFRKRIRGERMSRYELQLAPLAGGTSGASGLAVGGRW